MKKNIYLSAALMTGLVIMGGTSTACAEAISYGWSSSISNFIQDTQKSTESEEAYDANLQQHSSINYFDLAGYTATVTTTNDGYKATIAIYAPNGGYFDHGILTYGLGDLFLNTDTDSPWDYVADLGYTATENDDGSTVTTKGSVMGYTYSAAKVLTGSVKNMATPVAASGTQENNTVIGDWEIFNKSTLYPFDILNISLDLSKNIWNGSTSITAQLSQLCGNDILTIIIPAAVPAPSAMILFSSALLALAGIGRRQRHV